MDCFTTLSQSLDDAKASTTQGGADANAGTEYAMDATVIYQTDQTQYVDDGSNTDSQIDASSDPTQTAVSAVASPSALVQAVAAPSMSLDNITSDNASAVLDYVNSELPAAVTNAQNLTSGQTGLYNVALAYLAFKIFIGL